VSKIVTVNNHGLTVLEYRGQRVITLAQIDTAHERPTGTAGRNFREHRERLAEGADYFIASSDEIRRNNPGAIPDALRRRDVILLTETGYTMLVKPFNDELAWQVQRQIVSGYFAAARLLSGQAAPQMTGYVVDGCTLIESMQRALNLAPSATLGMYQKLGALAGIGDLVPAYTIDAPAANGSSSAPTLALKDLLLKFQVGISSQKAYRIMEQAGLVVHLSRPGKTETKWFWSFTEAGKAYGKNMTSPANPRETQPHFYMAEFPKLLQAIGLQGLLGAA